MTLRDHLLARKGPLAKQWFERVLSTYPQASAKALGRHTNSFGNPFAKTVLPALEAILEGVVGGAKPQDVRPHLDAVVRVRAVQDMRPGTALAFLVQLKDLLREEASALTRSDGGGNGSGAGDRPSELRILEDRIDGAQLMAFDLYTACREQVQRLRSDQRARALEMVTPGRPSSQTRGGVGRGADAGPAANTEGGEAPKIREP